MVEWEQSSTMCPLNRVLLVLQPLRMHLKTRLKNFQIQLCQKCRLHQRQQVEECHRF